MAQGLNYENSALKKSLSLMPEKVQAALRMYMSTKAIEIESKMKANRKWADRTNQAKAMLNATSVKKDNSLAIRLAQGVDYGIYLELAHEQNYAIIKPTIQAEQGNFLKDINNIFGNVGV